MFIYLNAEAEKWSHYPMGMNIIAEGLGFSTDDVDNMNDKDFSAFMELLEEIPWDIKVKSAQEGRLVFRK